MPLRIVPVPTLPVLLTLILALPCAALAGHPLGVDDPGTLDPHAYELEIAAHRAGENELNCREYAVGLRRGLLDGVDAGASLCAVDPTDGPGSSALGLDLKLAHTRARGWRPAAFVRLDAAVADLDRPSLQWGGVAVGAAWSPAVADVYVELAGFVPEGDPGGTEEVSLGVALHREVTATWAVMAEWGHAPFDGRGRDDHALLGAAHEFSGFGVVSLGFVMGQHGEEAWTPSQWTVGFTRELSGRFF